LYFSKSINRNTHNMINLRKQFTCFIFIAILFVACKNDDPVMPIPLQKCNGSELLCDKKYNEVTFLTTHNAYNYSDAPAEFALPNQTHNITKQLEDGVRSFMLDIYNPDQWLADESAESIWLYHSFSFTGSVLFSDELVNFKNFLDANENEVITFILETYVPFPLLKEAFEAAGLTQYLYSLPNNNAEWPTLSTMIENNTRLVILSEAADATADDWYIDIWQICVETHFSNNAQSDFSCNYNRGDANNELFILNHFITDATLGIGEIDSTNTINQYELLLNRVELCESETGKRPNFIAVDFYELGNTLEVVDYLNY